jgi:hypothetical protein
MQPTIAINGVDLGAMGFKVRSPNGIWNTPVASSEGIQVPGRAGQLVPQASMVTLASRTIDIVGTLVGTSRADFLDEARRAEGVPRRAAHGGARRAADAPVHRALPRASR